MRGYFTFLIVFAAFLLLISLAQFNSNAKTSNAGSAIWVERYYQVQMNAKEAVVEAAREGAKQGFSDYFSSLTIDCGLKKCVSECAKCSAVSPACLTGEGCVATGAACTECTACVGAKAVSKFSVPCLNRKINAAGVAKIKSLDAVRFDQEIDVKFQVPEVEDCSDVCNADGSMPDDIVVSIVKPNPAALNGSMLYSDMIGLGAASATNKIFPSYAPSVLVGSDKIAITLERKPWQPITAQMPQVYEEIS